MDIRLIAMDLDGTALQADRATFSPRLDAALERAHRKGVAVAPITGRQFFALPPAVRPDAAWAGLVVLCNGSVDRRPRVAALFPTHYLGAGGLLPIVDTARQPGPPT